MKKITLFLITVFFIVTAHSQTNSSSECKSIITINDSLFNKKTDPYDFHISTENVINNVLKSQLLNINDIIVVEDNCLKFRISYSCGGGGNEKILVTNRQVFQANGVCNFYKIKLLFINENKGCLALCHDYLSFNLSSLKINSEVEYLKFEGFTQLIKFND